MADQLSVDLIVKCLGNGFGEVVQDVNKIGSSFEEAGKQATSSGLKMTELKSTIDLIGQVAKQTGEIVKGVFEFGQEGAEITQTAESFDYLNEKLGLSNDLLQQLRDASNNTITDFNLMSSTTKLLQGTTDSLGKSLGDATPKLLEIAKAANKINPSLGSTAFLYESISTGIKRASPMILDNLGLTIKVGDANEVYAKQIGKAVDQLSAEEQKIALLNAVLEQGGNILEQAGGSAVSAADDYAKLETSLENLTNTLKAKYSPAIAELVTGLDVFINSYDTLTNALSEHEKDIRLTTGSYDDYTGEMLRATRAAGYHARNVDDLSRYVVILTEDEYNLGKEQAANNDIFSDYLGLLPGVNSQVSTLTENTEFLYGASKKIQAIKFEASLQDIANATAAIRDNAQAATDSYNSMATALQNVNFTSDADAQIAFYEKLRQSGTITEEQFKDISKNVLIAGGQASEQSFALADAQTLANTMMLEGLTLTTEQVQQLPGILAAVASDGAVSMGELETAFIDAGLTTQEQVDAINNIDLGEATTQASNLATQLYNISAMPTDKTFTYKVNVVTTGNVGLLNLATASSGGSSSSGYVGGGAQGIGWANGGSFEIPPGYPNDSFYLGAGNWGQSGETVDVIPPNKAKDNKTVLSIDYNKLGKVVAREVSKLL